MDDQQDRDISAELRAELEQELGQAAPPEMLGQATQRPQPEETQALTRSNNYMDQFNRMSSIHTKLKGQLRMRIVELENQFQRDRLNVMLVHEEEIRDMNLRHEEALNELHTLLGKLS